MEAEETVYFVGSRTKAKATGMRTYELYEVPRSAAEAINEARENERKRASKSLEKAETLLGSNATEETRQRKRKAAWREIFDRRGDAAGKETPRLPDKPARVYETEKEMEVGTIIERKGPVFGERKPGKAKIGVG